MMRKVLVFSFLLMVAVAPLVSAEDSGDKEFTFAKTVMLDNRDNELALKYFLKFVESNPRHTKAPEALVLMGECYVSLNKHGAAYNVYSRVVGEFPQAEPQLRRDAMLGMGHSAFYLKKYDKAIDGYSRLLKDYPTSTLAADALQWRAESYMNLARDAADAGKSDVSKQYYVTAASDFTNFLKRYPESKKLPAILPGAGLAFKGKGDYASAIQSFSRMVREFGAQQDADYSQLQIAECYYEQQQYGKARAEYERLLQSYKNSAYRSYAFTGKGLCDYSLAGMARDSGKEREARELFVSAAKNYGQAAALSANNPNEADAAFFRAGMAYRDAGSFDEAVENMLRVKSDVDGGLFGRSRFHAGSFRLEQARSFKGDGKRGERLLLEAVTYLKQAVDSKSIGIEKPEAAYFLGEVCLDRADYDSAIKIFLEVSTKYPNDERAPWSLYHMALALSDQSAAFERSGKVEQAKKNIVAAKDALQQLFRNYPKSRLRVQAAFAMADYQERLGEKNKSRGAYGWIVSRGIEAASKWKGADGRGDPELVEKAKGLVSESLFRLADSYFPDEDRAKAEQYYRQLLKDYPESKRASFTMLRLAEISELSGDFDSALRQYTAIANGKNGSTSRTAFFKVGSVRYHMAHGMKGKPQSESAFRQAVDALGKYIASAGKSDEFIIDAYTYRAESLYSLGSKEKALKDYYAAISLSGGKPADVLLSGAAWCLRDLAEADRQKARIANDKSIIESASKKNDDAIKYFNSLITSYPKSSLRSEAMFELAVCLNNRQDYAGALKVATRLENEYPQAPLADRAAVFKGQVLTDSGKIEQAIASYNVYLEKNANGKEAADALYGLYRAWWEMVKPRMKLAKDAQKAYFDNAGADNAAQLKKAWDDKLAEARALEDKMAVPLLRLVKDYPQYRYIGAVFLRLGEIAYDRGKYDDSLSLYSKAAASSNNTSVAEQAEYMVGLSGYRLYLAEKDTGKKLSYATGAKAAFVNLAKRYPKSLFAAESLYRAGEIDRESAAYGSATALYQKVISGYPKSKFTPSAAYGVGVCHLEAKQYREALGDFKAIVEAYPNDEKSRDAQWGAGHACYMLGAYEDAKGYFNKVQSGDYRGEAAAKAVFGMGMICMAESKFVAAREEFLKVSAFYGEWRNWAALALLKASQSARKLAEKDKKHLENARMDLELIVKRYGDTPSSAEAKRELEKLK